MSSTVPGRRTSPRSQRFVVPMCSVDPARKERPLRDESSTSSGHAFELPRCCLNVQSCRPSCESWSSSCAHPKGLGGSSGCAQYWPNAQNSAAAMGAQANRASAAAMRGRVLRSLPGEEGSFARNPSEPGTAPKIGLRRIWGIRTPRLSGDPTANTWVPTAARGPSGLKN